MLSVNILFLSPHGYQIPCEMISHGIWALLSSEYNLNLCLQMFWGLWRLHSASMVLLMASEGPEGSLWFTAKNQCPSRNFGSPWKCRKVTSGFDFSCFWGKPQKGLQGQLEHSSICLQRLQVRSNLAQREVWWSCIDPNEWSQNPQIGRLHLYFCDSVTLLESSEENRKSSETKN